MQLKGFAKSNHKVGIFVIIILIVALVLVCTSFAFYNREANHMFISGTVGSFNDGDVNIAILVDGASVPTFPVNQNYTVTVDCGSDATGEWDYDIWGLVITNFEKTKASCTLNFTTLITENAIENREYTNAETVNWAGLDWYVLSDNGENVTLMLKDVYSSGLYGSISEWSISIAKTKVNEDFVNANSIVKEAIEERSVVYDRNSRSYIRIPTQSELSSNYPTGNSIGFWTMTSLSETSMIFGNSSGTLGSDCTRGGGLTLYRGNNASTITAYRTQSCTNSLGVSRTSFNTTTYERVGGSPYTKVGSYPGNYDICWWGFVENNYVNTYDFTYASPDGCGYYDNYNISSTSIGYRPILTVIKTS